MTTQFLTVGILMLLSAMLPGPDFALVVKNTFLISRRAGIFTALGIGSAILVHVTYCILGLGFIISQSPYFFNLIRYAGAAYLIYIGFLQIFSEVPHLLKNESVNTANVPSPFNAFKEGFLCNLLNPKATLFFLAIFTAIIDPKTPVYYEVAYAIEMFLITVGWFVLLAVIISHPRIVRLLNRIEKYISKILGIVLIGFGIALALF